MFIPEKVDLEAFIGGTFSQTFQFFDDDAQTQVHDFTGWTPEFIVTLFDGTKLTGSAAISSNSITIGLTSVQTTGLEAQPAKFYVGISTSAAPPDQEFLVEGTLELKAL